MKVQLLKPVAGIGRAGEIVTVGDAHARNFLLPKKLAVAATTKVVHDHQHHQAQTQQAIAQHQTDIQALIVKLQGQTVPMSGKANPQGKLFASIKAEAIRQQLEHQFHLKINRFRSQPDHVKTVGQHQLNVTIEDVPPFPLTLDITNG